MSAELRTIINAYEQEGMSPLEIAEDRDLDLTAVKTALMQGSSKYRKDCGKEEEEVDELNFSNEELRRANQVIVDLALGSEDDHLRLKAATYIRDDKKGRKEVTKALAGNNFNVLFINEQLKKVRSVTDEMKQSVLSGNSGKQLVNV